MPDYASFQKFSPTSLADVLSRSHIMDIGIRPLWPGMPRVAGPAFTVRCPPGDSLSLYGAVYRAEPGSILVVEAGDTQYAVAGGNLCAVAQQRGNVALLVDGVVRDLVEIRDLAFPVLARGVIPISGAKAELGTINTPVKCGGVTISPGDVIVADEEGVVVVPESRLDEIRKQAQVLSASEANETLESWTTAHQARTEELLRRRGFRG